MEVLGKKKAKARKRGFTIVELLVVVAVLGVLMGIISTAASSVIRKARVRKNEALRTLLQQGIATYQAQRGYWPPSKSGQLENWAKDGFTKQDETGYLTDSQYDEMMRHLMKECLNARGNPIMDVSGFAAARVSAVNGRKDRDGKPSCGAEEVQTWVAKQRAGNGPKSNEMVFGYTNPEQNHFRRFRVRFYPESGSVKVEL